MISSVANSKTRRSQCVLRKSYVIIAAGFGAGAYFAEAFFPINVIDHSS